MALRYFLSLTAFSLMLSCVSADQYVVSNIPDQEELLDEDSNELAEAEREEHVGDAVKIRRVTSQKEEASTSKNGESTATEPKKQKAHFAGVRKPEPKAKKKSSKIKNQWFSSKTHPKAEKKSENAAANIQIASASLPSDRPFYIRKAQLTAQNTPKKNLTPPASSFQQEGELYPHMGFQAPDGHVYLTAEYLLWRTRQEGTEFATAKQVNFIYNSGFRVGLGVHMPHDGWDIYAAYTRFVPERSRSVHGSFYPLFMYEGVVKPATPNVAKTHAHWEIEFQAIDLELGRAYAIAKTLTLRPFFGLKSAWIDQHAKCRYEGGFIPAGQTFHTHFKNDFKGAGPLVGLEANWLVGAGFSLFGDLAASLVIGHFDNKQEQDQLNDAEVVHLGSNPDFVSPFLQILTGVAWDRNFSRDRYHASLSAGFETQYWGNQNQIEQFTAQNAPIYMRERGALAFYGLTLKARVDF